MEMNYFLKSLTSALDNPKIDNQSTSHQPNIN